MAVVDPVYRRLVALPPGGEWRRPGCGDRCIRVISPLMGSYVHEWIEAHDPDAHEAYMRDLLTPKVVRTGPLVVQLDQYRVWVDGAEVPIAGARWTMLQYLAERLDRIVKPTELLEAIDPYLIGASAPNYLTVMLGHLRGRLGAAGRLIENRPRVGYRLRAEPF